MKFKNSKLKICSLFLAVLMVFQLCFFCPCTYAGYNRLMQILKDGENLTVEDIKPIVEEHPEFVKETYSGKTKKRKTVLYYAIERGRNTSENRIAIVKYLVEKGAGVGPVFEGFCGRHGTTPLEFAVDEYHDACVRLLLERGADPNQGDSKYGWTPLHVAALRGDDDWVRLFLEKGADPNKADEKDDTPLHFAAEKGSDACVRLLLEGGADPSCKTRYGKTPLQIARENKHESTVRILEERIRVRNERILKAQKAEAAEKFAALFVAVQNGDFGKVSSLLKSGADPNQGSKSGFTPLHIAANRGDDDCVKCLLKGGADPSRKTKDGRTPLQLAKERNHESTARLLESYAAPTRSVAIKESNAAYLFIAAGTGNADELRSLLEHGADPNQYDQSGFTPLHIAARRGDDDCVEVLIEGGADSSCKAKNGKTPLQLAKEKNHESTAKLLELYIAKKTDAKILKGKESVVGTADQDSRVAALLEATAAGDADKVRSLLEDGVNPNQRSKRGLMPLHIAAKRGNDDCVEVLLEGGADPSCKTKDGKTPSQIARENNHKSTVEILSNPKVAALFAATEAGNADKVRLLLESGADPNRRDKLGNTPLHIAAKGGHEACVRVLLEKGADPNLTNREEETPRNVCTNPGVDALLKAHGGKKPGSLKRFVKSFVD